MTVGQLRAELVGLPDDMPIAVDVLARSGGEVWTRYRLTGAGYGPGVDVLGDPILADAEFPLQAAPSDTDRDGNSGIDLSWPRDDRPSSGEP